MTKLERLEAINAELLQAAESMVTWWDRYAGYTTYYPIEQLRAAIAIAKLSDDNQTTTTNGEQP